jgi:DNA repair exonuclease SbcCD ATPase subunit
MWLDIPVRELFIYRMQDEMEKRLEQLAEDFQKATNIRVADVMHTAVRRNIALNRELNSLLRAYQDVEAETAEIRDNDRLLRLENELYETEAKIAQGDVISNREIMHKFARRHIDMYQEHGQMLRANRKFTNYEQRIKHYEALSVRMQERERFLEREIEQVRKDRERILAEVRGKYEELDRVNKLLAEAKQRVLEMLQVHLVHPVPRPPFPHYYTQLYLKHNRYT